MGCRAIEVKVRYLSSDFSLMFKDQQLNNKQIKTTPESTFLRKTMKDSYLLRFPEPLTNRREPKIPQPVFSQYSLNPTTVF